MSSKLKPNEIEMHTKGEKDQGSEKLIPPSPETQGEISTFKYILIILFSILIKVLQPLAIQNSKDKDGKYLYNESTMVLLVEVVKLVFCSVVFMIQYQTSPVSKRVSLTALTFTQSLHFLVPAVLYAASNTLVYVGMSYISAAFFHVFGNIRILTAGILYRIMMKRKQTDVQWASMVLIAAGALLSSSEEKKGKSENPILGFVFIMAMTVFSTSASIYTEKYFKKNQEVSIFYQNIILYSYGILVNILVLAVRSSDDKGIFEGFDKAGFLVLLVQSTMGVSLSFIFKYLDNIVYVISLVVSMFLTAIVTTITTDFSFSLNFITALSVVTIGIYLFYRTKIFERFSIDEKNASL
jgi:UDP-galactose transporter